MATTGAHACMRPDFERVRLQLLYCFPVQAILAPSILIRCVPQQGQYGCSVPGLGGSAQRPRQRSVGGRQLRTIYGADFGLQQRTRRGDSGSPCARPALVAGAPLRERAVRQLQLARRHPIAWQMDLLVRAAFSATLPRG